MSMGQVEVCRGWQMCTCVGDAYICVAYVLCTLLCYCGSILILYSSPPHPSPLPSTSFTPPLPILHPSPPHPSPLPSTSFTPLLPILHPSTSFTSPFPSLGPKVDFTTFLTMKLRGRSQRDWCVNPWGMKEAPDSHLRCGELHLDF